MAADEKSYPWLAPGFQLLIQDFSRHRERCRQLHELAIFVLSIPAAMGLPPWPADQQLRLERLAAGAQRDERDVARALEDFKRELLKATTPATPDQVM